MKDRILCDFILSTACFVFILTYFEKNMMAATDFAALCTWLNLRPVQGKALQESRILRMALLYVNSLLGIDFVLENKMATTAFSQTAGDTFVSTFSKNNK